MEVKGWLRRGGNKGMLNCLRARFRRLLWSLLALMSFMDQIGVFKNRRRTWVRI